MTKKIGYIILAFVLLLAVVLLVFLNKHPKLKSSPIPIKRYEIALMEIDTNRVGEELHRLYKEFPLFLEGADLDDPHNQEQILNFVTDPRSKELLNDILEKYPNLTPLEKTFGESFKRYNLLFEKEKIPTIYTYMSYLDYDNRVIFMDSVLVIAIDMYLGADNKHYNAIALPMYIRMRLDEPFIAVDGMRAVAHYQLEKTPQSLQTLLDHMIFNGKVAYFLEKTLPNTDAAIRFGYTPEQMAWCRKNEKTIWSYLVGSKLLYERDSFKYRTFVSEAPTVQIFPGSPGRIGHFLGYRIVKKYMENTGQTVPELFAETDSQKILRLSNYRP
ncbi:MAG: DUF2268 domain-containing putative Zn-dependent protease [Bacteroidales bacterium]|nr:DUF2268 domain-containing putative Zn-dependent protease [Bacteroidales bacterium]